MSRVDRRLSGCSSSLAIIFAILLVTEFQHSKGLLQFEDSGAISSGMNADERKAVELIRQGQQQIRAAVSFLVKEHGPLIIALCRDYVDRETAQAMAAEVIARAVETLGDYKGDDLRVPLAKAAIEMAQAKQKVMLPKRWEADQERQEQRGSTVKEREDLMLLRFRKFTNMRWKQIAEIMGMTDVQARVRYHRALLDRSESKNERKSS